MTPAELVHIVDPKALERARRLEFAIRQVASGIERARVVAMVRAQFRCSVPTSYRVVEMAIDLAGPTK